ncbi:hypothetical protein ACQUJS_05495 [Ralstonia pseudosolanacearum]|uniref:Uncharacterized protein n=1 Tax=Ralstonia solanacearum TaxID=305 RepID=A0AA92IFY4_RALSL|nr:hypothetical protein [Ralstonia pseudosolanacearum]OAI75789.1 hypothetical protein RSP799_22640 [Ralstonia solanacearum]QCX51557.1 hypothetical protein E7Z57_21235 [Ralstonia pseudosolanacearum]
MSFWLSLPMSGPTFGSDMPGMPGSRQCSETVNAIYSDRSTACLGWLVMQEACQNADRRVKRRPPRFRRACLGGRGSEGGGERSGPMFNGLNIGPAMKRCTF